MAGFSAPKETPPAGPPPKPFHLSPTDDFQLPNGMKVTMVPYGVVPRVALRAFVDAGAVNESASQVWLAQLTALLMKEGAGKRSGAEVAEAAAECGGQLEIDAGSDTTSVGGVVLSEFAPKFIALIADVLRNPTLPESELARLKTDLARELAVSQTQPGALARARFLEVMFPGHAYGRVFPTESMLQGFRIDDVKSFYTGNFGAARTHLYIAGKFDAGLKAAVRTAFEGWAKGPEPKDIPARPVKGRSLSVIDRPGAQQSTLYIGLPVASPSHADAIPLGVLNALLGGSFASRITSNIREQKGYTYSPSGQIGTRKHQAFWLEVADVTTGVTGPSLKEIFYEVDRIRKDPPTEAELKGIQNYLAGTFILRNTVAPDTLIQQIQYVDSQGLDRSYLTNYVTNVMKVTPAEVQRLAETYLIPSQMTIVVVGDKAKIADQVQPYEKASQ
jgi:predicted Zn-dependent peptidase